MKARNCHSIPAAAVLAAAISQTAFAQDPDVEALVTPQSELRAGLGGIIGDSRWRGLYTGLNEPGAYPLLDLSLISRDDATGAWMRLNGRNLGLDSREARAEYERQGDFNIFLDFSQTPRFNPLIIDTPIEGIGNSINTLGAITRQVDLDTERLQGKIGISKTFGDGFDAKVTYRREQKNGARQWGLQGPFFVAEPIDFSTDEVETTIGYADRSLQLQAGYLGSFFSSKNEFLSVPYADPEFQQVALPFDNSLHQVHASGGYNFTPTTRAYFKASYGQARQDEDFFTAPSFPGNTRTNVGGRVDTTLVHLGFNAQPLDKLTTTAKVRYEDRNDKTDTAQYIPAERETTGFNVPFSRSSISADLEASYRLPLDFRLTGGVLWEQKDRSVPVLREASYRGDTEETALRIELRRSLLENLGGAIAYINSDRSGSVYLPSSLGVNRIDPLHWADRDRDKIRASLDWAPTEALSTQLIIEGSRDTYEGRLLGPREGRSAFASLDATYTITDEWDVTGWASLEDVRVDQATTTPALAGASPAQDWAAELRQLGTAVGFGIRGQLTAQLKVGGNLQQSWDTNEYQLRGFVAPVASLPDIRYRQTDLTVFLDYRILANSGVRLDYGFARITTNDWTWTNWTYNDGTTVQIPAQENTHFVGVSYYVSW